MKNKALNFLLLVTISFTYFNTCAQQAPHEYPQPGSIANGPVPSDKVCFINNKYMGDKPQIPVVVEGKTYYGCCAGCVTALQSSSEARHAKDPLTGQEVDKATAYIVLKPDSSGDVLYFASKSNYEKYLKKKK